mgnify:CR=1 FL=1
MQEFIDMGEFYLRFDGGYLQQEEYGPYDTVEEVLEAAKRIGIYEGGGFFINDTWYKFK